MLLKVYLDSVYHETESRPEFIYSLHELKRAELTAFNSTMISDVNRDTTVNKRVANFVVKQPSVFQESEEFRKGFGTFQKSYLFFMEAEKTGRKE